MVTLWWDLERQIFSEVVLTTDLADNQYETDSLESPRRDFFFSNFDRLAIYYPAYYTANEENNLNFKILGL